MKNRNARSCGHISIILLSALITNSISGSFLEADVVEDGLLFFISGSAPGSDPDNIWKPVVGSGGALYEGTVANKPVYDNTSEGFGFYSFDGGNYAMYPEQTQLAFSGDCAYTIETWIKFSERQINKDYDVFGTKGRYAGFNGWRFQPYYNASRGADRNGVNGEDGQIAPKFYLQDRADPVQRWYANITGYSFDGELWTHVVITYDPSITSPVTGAPMGEIWTDNNSKTVSEDASGGLGTDWQDPDVDGDWITEPVHFYVGKIPLLTSDSGGTESPFWGDIAAVRIYNRALTSPEVSQNYTAGPGGILNFAAEAVMTGNSMEVAEGGNSDVFGVILKKPPISDVTVTLSFNSADIAVSPTSLTFTSSDWNQMQMVTVAAVDDILPEGDETAKIALTAGGEFTGQAILPVKVDIVDNDIAEIVITPVNLRVSEEGETSDTFSVNLTLAPVSSDVTVSFNYDANQFLLDAASLTFTASNWSVPQSVTVTGIEDSDYEPSPYVAIIETIILTDDILYNSIDSDNILVDILDNDCGPSRQLGADVDKNCYVDFYDFAKLATDWLIE